MIRAALLALVIGCGGDPQPVAAPSPNVPATPEPAKLLVEAKPLPDAAPEPTIVLAPGSWPHVTAHSPCKITLDKAPPDERRARIDAAILALTPLAGTPQVELSELTDRVMRVDYKDPRTPMRAPKTGADAVARAKLILSPDIAALFGLSADEVAGLAWSPTRPTNGGAVVWEVAAKVTREPDLDKQPMRLGASALVMVAFDRKGGLRTIKVTGSLLPPITLCDARLDEERVKKAVVGVHLIHWGHHGRRDEGPIAPTDIESIERAVTGPINQVGLHFPYELELAYVVHARRKHMVWELRVDPRTGLLLENEPTFND